MKQTDQHSKNHRGYSPKKGVLMLLMSAFFLTGCEDEEVMSFTKSVFKSHVAQKELGRCENEPGTLVESYHPWWITRIADAILLTPKQEGSPVKHCIPDIDPNVVAALTPEQKAKNRSDFVNAFHKTGYHKKFTKESGKVIELSYTFLELQELARRGEELAQIELNLTDYYTGEVKRYQFKDDNKHYQRLKELAESGDGEAMCLYARRYPTPFKGYEGIANGGNFKKWYQEGPEDKSAKGILKAAKKGGMDCMVIYALTLTQTEPEKITVPPNPELGLEYLIKAGIKGSKRAAWMLTSAYSQEGNRYGVAFNVGKAECWSKIHDQLFPESRYPFSTILSFAKENKIDTENYIKYDVNSYCQKELKS